jgi:hypothetical protein
MKANALHANMVDIYGDCLVMTTNYTFILLLSYSVDMAMAVILCFVLFCFFFFFFKQGLIQN